MMRPGRHDPPPAIRPPQAVASTENFPVALRVLPRQTRRHLMALYGYARFLDDLGDEPAAWMTPADRLAALDRFEAGVRDLYRGYDPGYPVLRQLAPTVARCTLPIQPLLRLIEANRMDQTVHRYATFEQLVEYCSRSANPVGHLVLQVFGRATPDAVALSDLICTGLQIVEHLQDLGEDHRRGRIYLPKEDMDRFGVTEDDLALPSAPEPLRDLVAFEAERARSWLEAGAPLVSCLRGWSRVAVGGYLAGGRAALHALARRRYDPLPAPPKAGRPEMARQWLVAYLRSAG